MGGGQAVPTFVSLSGLLFLSRSSYIGLSTFLNTTARVGRNMDSGLEECYKSLANVQSPSRSHADLGAFAPMKKGP
jgi:hypothetical protein